jgi:3-isopropylmalate/(R)-2-methylmalate dehydratase large subunit
MGMTIVEKIMARASGAATVSPGDVVEVTADTIVMIDLNFGPQRHEILKVCDPERIVVVLDHDVPAPNQVSARMHGHARDFVRRFGIRRMHDVGAGQGISHVIVMENAYALPGSILVCADSHTCAAGALNCAARGIGTPDMALATATGRTWFRIGGTVRYELEDRLAPGVSAKDLFLHIAATYGEHVNQNVEYGGPGLAHLSMNARLTLSTMSAELSAEFATFEPDDILLDHVRARSSAPFTPQYADADAAYVERRHIAMDQLQPLVALPDGVIRNAVPVGNLPDTPIHQAFIGSCANGTLDDLAEAARVVRGRQVAAGVRLLVTPGSQAIFRAAMQAGYVQTLMEAGAVVTPATCGACYGGHMGLLGPGETCITASTRNFKGRMGDPSARIYMGSPATVAASAIAGRIAHPAETAGDRA